MTPTLSMLALVSALEWLAWFPPIWKHLRKPVAIGAIIAVAIGSGWLLGFYWTGWSGVIAMVGVYRIVNLLRLIEDRLPVDYLRRITLRTSFMLVCFQVVVVVIVSITRHFHLRSTDAWNVFLIADAITAALLYFTTLSHLRFVIARSSKAITEEDLPTLTVALPARNETDDLRECLQTLVTSSYPKLEILVLDDCSQDKRTPDIIKDFAHAGVRFIAGEAPPEHWLAKNYAYQQLAEEANGSLLLFCGVDTRFLSNSLTEIVTQALARKNQMLSVMPRNVSQQKSQLEAFILQPIRYAWELALPRRWLGHPPVLSTCWLIDASFLKKNGGFKAITNSSSVEEYFARAADQTKVGYSFIQSNAAIGLTSQKSLPDQRNTAIRTRYPQTHRHPEIVAALTGAEILIFLLPYVLLIGSLFTHDWLRLVVGLIDVAFVSAFYVRMLTTTFQVFTWRSLWLAPLAALYDIGMLNYSMWRYEFREVIWKGRNVCIPVMKYGDAEAASYE